jgi:hypothetical protein
MLEGSVGCAERFSERWDERDKGTKMGNLWCTGERDECFCEVLKRL